RLVRECVEPLVSWYPECPLRSVFFEAGCETPTEGLNFFKGSVACLYSRRSAAAMMVQATMLSVAFDADALKGQKGSALSRLEEIEHYPNTETSRVVGSMVRATLNAMLGEEMPFITATDWPKYFWNRGLTISPCEFDQ